MAILIIKLYVILFALSVLLLHPVWAADKYILPIVPFIILFVARGMITKTPEAAELRTKKTLLRLTVPLAIILLALLLLSNAIYIGVLAVRQVGDNIAYIKGDKYAGYPPDVRQMFLDMERARGLPDDAVIYCRKPEFLYLISQKKSLYPWQIDKEAK